jgi:hypothetical protein
MKTASVLSLTDPYASTHGGTLRTRALLQVLSQLGIVAEPRFPQLSMGARASTDRGSSRAQMAIGRAKRQYLPMPTMLGSWSPALADELLSADDDLLVVSVLSQAMYARKANSALWLDFSDLTSLFGLKEADHRRGLARATARVQSRWLRHQERSYGRRARLVTATGWEDNQALLSMGLDSHWLPTPLSDDQFRTVERTSTSGLVAGFIGNFEYWPNREAYSFLTDQWLPAVTRAGGTVLVAGRASMTLDAPPSGVEILGEVDSVDEFYSNVDLTLAPVRRGGGMKVKVLESLSRGRPVIGSPAAFDGFDPELRARYLAESDGRDLAAIMDELEAPDPTSQLLTPYRFSAAVALVKKLLVRGL